MVSVFPARQGRADLRTINKWGVRDRARAALRAVHQRCVGCETQGRPGRSGRPIERQERWGNRRRRSRRRGAAAASERRAVRTLLRAVVRGTVPAVAAAAPARGSALVRARVQGARHGVRRPRAEAMPTAGAAGRGEGGENCDERGTQRRREEDPAVPLTVRSNEAPGVPVRQRRGAQRAAGQAKRGASVSSRRRQGLQWKSRVARLERKARPRSGSPRFIVRFTALPSILQHGRHRPRRHGRRHSNRRHHRRRHR